MPGLLAFHAHPDDESITMGGTIASLVDRGVPVRVVTATRGEVGEIHNRDDADEIRDQLGAIREAELAAALAELGAGEPAFLGYRDSGMMGTADNDHPEAFWGADFDEAVGRLVAIIRQQRPFVVTAYDPFGGYGHPDHVQVHRVGTAAYWAAADVGRYPADEFGEPWWPSKLYWATWSREGMVKVRREMSGDLGADDVEEPAAGSLRSHITTSVDVTAVFGRKHDALLAHDTQFSTDSWVRTVPRSMLKTFLGTESYYLVHSSVDVDAADSDLMSGADDS
jgi:N-acetyl-1-D-myo-inositol-2-amino-2-deoxy-alpha-D-glucopyranoside deacetylase